MRYNHPKHGDERKRRGFLFWPKRVAYQTRWLERVVWEEQFALIFGKRGHWWAFQWVDDDEEQQE